MNRLRLLKRLWLSIPLSDHSRWRLASMVLEPVLPFIKGGVVHAAYLREKEWQNKHLSSAQTDKLPRLPNQENADIFFWGSIDWRYRIARPQHLARGLADQGHRVFYISTAFVNAKHPGFELESLDVAGRLYGIRLHLRGRPMVNMAPPSQEDLRFLTASLAMLLKWSRSQRMVSVVQHPYWYELARTVPGVPVIYDCIDLHVGFENVGVGIASTELTLLKEAEAVVTTSKWLYDIAVAYNRNVELIRNAAEYDFFSAVPESAFVDTQGRRVLGYFGALAHWVDVDLLEQVARQFTHCLLLLVGADECNARQRLANFPNVQFTGEVKYSNLTHYLYGMDICLIPFKVIPLTLATNPVKVYEYLAAGKPVVSVALPELEHFDSLVSTASTHGEFIKRIEETLANTNDGQRNIRQEFAARNTWQDRVGEFESMLLRLIEPQAT